MTMPAVKCKWCNNSAKYKTLQMCNGCYTKHKYRIKCNLTTNLAIRLSRLKMYDRCRICGAERLEGISIAACKPCFDKKKRIASIKWRHASPENLEKSRQAHRNWLARQVKK